MRGWWSPELRRRSGVEVGSGVEVESGVERKSGVEVKSGGERKSGVRRYGVTVYGVGFRTWLKLGQFRPRLLEPVS